MRIPMLEDVVRSLSILPGFQKPLTSESSSGLSEIPPSLKVSIPGGSPFSFCEVSRPTDLFSITSVELTEQPVYIDDYFTVHLYGTFQESWTANATLEINGNCGSHCEEYGRPPFEETPPGEPVSLNFCDLSKIEQPLGGKKKHATSKGCPPEEGYALITSPGFIATLFLNVPGWYNFTFDAKTAEEDRIYCLTTEVCLRYENEDKNKGFPPGPWNNCTWPR
ncbi:hypothetical protein F4781DRAFT_380433 [Annulohypoxylon bovei var. microspora]|nr:hypothetical protein F4781DRAFT_380433 [Annulohypoxylon bovei var. microspora]